MNKINVGDFCRVKKSKYLATGSFVEILMEIQQGIFLCGNETGNTIIVAKNLKKWRMQHNANE
ncbi:hypothetical protein [uncultured Enterococcus sp.]|uniref:hypothetical protein n=1 Tax=uncultured Enterococcus sp. TaxID=167972 RepID=UPI002AA675F6|nr:hypothetical protein [uncultured Enterococcus sp.]